METKQMTVSVVAFSNTMAEISRESISLGMFYDSDHPAIDDDQFRREQGIRRLDATFYDENENCYQMWRTEYDENGDITSALRWRREEADKGWVPVSIEFGIENPD